MILDITIKEIALTFLVFGVATLAFFLIRTNKWQRRNLQDMDRNCLVRVHTNFYDQEKDNAGTKKVYQVIDMNVPNSEGNTGEVRYLTAEELEQPAYIRAGRKNKVEELNKNV